MRLPQLLALMCHNFPYTASSENARCLSGDLAAHDHAALAQDLVSLNCATTFIHRISGERTVGNRQFGLDGADRDRREQILFFEFRFQVYFWERSNLQRIETVTRPALVSVPEHA